MDEQCRCKQSMDASFEVRAYADRSAAGQSLADLAEGRWWQDVIVLAIGRGGVVVGAELARRLGAELDVMAGRRVRAPQRPEATLGAVCSDGTVVFNEPLVSALGIPQQVADEAAQRALRKARVREARWRSAPPIDLTGRTVLLVDDGMDTGATLRACIAALKRKDLRMLTAAVPVATHESWERVVPLVDMLICPFHPETLVSLGHHYRSFPQVSDRQVERTLQNHRAWLAAQSRHPSGQGTAVSAQVPPPVK